MPETDVGITAAAPRVAVIGAGPAGLMAAETLAAGGAHVDVYDAMPSVGRKFLLAGRGGLNLTHAEPTDKLLTRYAPGASQAVLAPVVRAFDGPAVRAWAQSLGIDTFVGSSSRVFPTDMKAAPLLRAWLHRLRVAGVRFHMRHRWEGWQPDGSLRFQQPPVLQGQAVPQPQPQPDATVLALGGGSWARLGSDGAWVPWLQAAGAQVSPLQAANCGFDVAPTAPDRPGWSPFLVERFAGQPIKPVVITFADAQGRTHRQQGEFVLTATGLEGSLIYAFSGRLREAIAQQGQTTVWLDLLPNHSAEQVLAEVSRPRGPRSLSTHLKSRLGLHGLKMALLHEMLQPEQLADTTQLAQAIKALPIKLARPRPLDEAISTAGGVCFESLDAWLMLRQRPGVFCAGEMLDWEAPTGGYLLTACLATGRHAGLGVLRWWQQRNATTKG